MKGKFNFNENFSLVENFLILSLKLNNFFELSRISLKTKDIKQLQKKFNNQEVKDFIDEEKC